MKFLLALLFSTVCFAETLYGTNIDHDTAEDIWGSTGALSYLSAAEIMDLTSADAKDTDFAVGVLTLSGNADDGDTVTIGTKVYTFQTVLTDVDGNVLIGTLATDSIDNLINAINLGAGSGTLYATSMTEHPTVGAAAGAGDTMDATSETGNNEAATTDDNSNMSWGDTTLINGVGLRSVSIEGLDNNYIFISENVSLDGTTIAKTTQSFLRIFKMVGKRVGSEADNAGAITATATTASSVQDVILAGYGRSQSLRYTVPAGMTAQIVSREFSMKDISSGTVVFTEMIREQNGSWQNLRQVGIITGQTIYNTTLSYILPAKTDFKLSGVPTVANSITYAEYVLEVK